MRRILPLVLTAVLTAALTSLVWRLSLPAAAPLQGRRSNSLEGTWRMTSLRWVYPSGDEIRQTKFRTPALRIHTRCHYAFGRQAEDGSLDAAGGGAYEVIGDTLIEHRDYHIAPAYVGTVSRMVFHVESTRLELIGSTPNGIQLEEHYERIE